MTERARTAEGSRALCSALRSIRPRGSPSRLLHPIFPIPVLEEAGEGGFPVPHFIADGAAEHPVIEGAPLGAVGAFGVLGLILLAGAGGHGGVHAGQTDDLGGKIIPRADALAGAVVEAVFVGHAELQNFVGQIDGVGRVAALVVDDLQLAELLARVHDGLDEILAVVAVEPRGAHNEVAVAELLDVLLAHELGGAVGADGAGDGGLILRDAAVLAAGENVVGGDMDQTGPGLGGSLREVAGAEGVGLEGSVVVHLAAVHIGVGGAVDDDIRALAADEVVHHLVVGDVQFRQVHRDDGGALQLFGDGADLTAALAELLDDLGAQLALAAGNDDFHVHFLLVSQFAVGHILQVLAVGALAVALGALQQGVAVDPAILEGNLFRGADLDALTLLDHADEVGGLHEAVHGAGIQPCKATAQQLNIQLILLQVHVVQGGDLQLAAGGRLHFLGHLDDFLVVEVQAGDGVVALRVLRLLFHAEHLAVLVELDDAEALRVRDIVTEDGAAALVLGVGGGVLQDLGEAVAVEDVIAEDHRAAVVADELLAEDECLCQTVRRGLDLILQMDAVLAAIAQQRLETGRVGGGRNNQDVLNARQHEGGQRIVDHRLVVDRQQLFAGDHGQRVKPGAGAAGENNAFHNLRTPLIKMKKVVQLYEALAAESRVIFKAELRPLSTKWRVKLPAAECRR